MKKALNSLFGKILFCLISLSSVGMVKAEGKVVAHVIVHGSRLSGLTVLSPLHAYCGTLSDGSWFKRAIDVARGNIEQLDTQPMQELGLIEIPRGTIDALVNNGPISSDVSRRAAVQEVAMYHIFNQGDDPVTNKYYTFGWSGILNAGLRQKAAEALYDALINMRDALKREFPGRTVEIVLDAHSHGGGTAFNLAYWETQKKQGLEIAYMLLYGTPIQEETVRYSESPVFKKIINIYSLGDAMQVMDCLSTHGKSKRCLSDYLSWINTPDHYRFDVCVRFNGNPRVFGHDDLFLLDAVAHDPALTYMRPFSVLIFAPLIMQYVDKLVEPAGAVLADLDFKITHNTFSLCLSTPACSIQTEDLSFRMQFFRHFVDATWRPYACSNPLVRNLCIAKTLIAALPVKPIAATAAMCIGLFYCWKHLKSFGHFLPRFA